MVHPYPEIYLDDAMRNLGEAVDYAVNYCGVDIDSFFSMFLSSGYANSFAKGRANLLVGLTGPEIAEKVLYSKGLMVARSSEVIEYTYSKEYWCGWAIALYQWETNTTFKKMFSKILPSEILKRYSPLHEASEQKVVKAIGNLIKQRTVDSQLKKLRESIGMSQSQFAKESEINIRTLQQYECGKRNLKKASYEILHNMASVLGCDIEDIVD